METLWFCLIAVMIAAYVVLDGFDLGVGMVYLFIARTDDERKTVIKSIGPFWDGNEVWLLAAGGTLYFAFPVLYASSFSGFYLPLMMVLWLLILRGMSVEMRSHVDVDLWKQFADAVFAISSALLAIFFGAALGNVIRGVPLKADGYFFLPLWTNFTPQQDAGILDWFTIPGRTRRLRDPHVSRSPVGRLQNRRYRSRSRASHGGSVEMGRRQSGRFGARTQLRCPAAGDSRRVGFFLWL